MKNNEKEKPEIIQVKTSKKPLFIITVENTTDEKISGVEILRPSWQLRKSFQQKEGIKINSPIPSTCYEQILFMLLAESFLIDKIIIYDGDKAPEIGGIHYYSCVPSGVCMQKPVFIEKIIDEEDEETKEIISSHGEIKNAMKLGKHIGLIFDIEPKQILKFFFYAAEIPVK